ncbi:MAG: alpha/beta hydrolase [Proteobacteria bacterium]|jgi:pimeloyl-ACP methyl ester carboxylesterase|nr:alpha/beta hydrolase [Pseudomonadota bacterium]
MRLEVAGRGVYAYTGTRAANAALPTIVFVHGAANDHGVFALQSRYFAWHGWNAIALDLPAHGRSEGPALASVAAIADWLITVLDAARVARAVFVGHSLGSLAVLECAGRHAGRVAKIALLAPAVPMTVADDLLAAAADGDHLAFELINGWSFGPAAQLGGNRVPGMWMLGNSMRLMERSAPGVLATDLFACHRYADGLAAAAAVRCESLVVQGTRDVMAPPRNARSLIDALPRPQVVTLPGAGHALMTEEPDRVLDALVRFAGPARAAA